MRRNPRRIEKTLAVMAVWAALIAAAPAVANDSNGSLPACFVSDTVYHVVLDLNENRIGLGYGSMPLLDCEFAPSDDPSDVADFAEEWHSHDGIAWQNVMGRRIMSGQPAISDTVISVVSSVANVDPELIKRIWPRRFVIEISGDFRLVVVTPEGAAEGQAFGDRVKEFGRGLVSFGRGETLTLIVSPEDAQTLYYALEPGAPVLVVAPAESAPADSKVALNSH